MGRMVLKIPKQFLSKDFLEIEVKKKLGVRGDDLIQHLRGEMREVHKHNSKSSMFSPKTIYMCEMVGNDVKLTSTLL